MKKKIYRYRKTVYNTSIYYDMIDEIKVIAGTEYINFYSVKSGGFNKWKCSNNIDLNSKEGYTITSTRVSYDMFKASPEISIEIIEYEKEKNI